MAQTRIPKAQLDTTLVDTTSSQILQSKSFLASSTTIIDPINTTKSLIFTTSGNTANIQGTLATSFTTAKTVTLPDATDTLIGKATTDTLTNKTFDTAGTGNVLKINGTAVTTVTGTGSNVLSTSPTLVTPVLGTPTSVTLTNGTGLPLTTGVTGTLPVANGGTGAITLTGVLKGTGTTAIAAAVAGTDFSVPSGTESFSGVKTFSTAPVISTITNTGTITLPTTTDTLVGRATTDTFTGVKTFGATGNVGKLAIAGTTSGTTILNASAVASGTLTLPAATDTLAGKATTDIFTNKTLNSTTNTVVPRLDYRFAAYASATTTLTASANTQIAFATEEFDTNNNFATNAYTAPVAGYYQFNATAQVTAGASNEDYLIVLYKNGVEFKRGQRVRTGGSGDQAITFSSFVQLAAADVMTIFMFNGTASSKTVSSGQSTTYFNGYLVTI